MQVWEYLLVSNRAVLLCRLGLDDESLTVSAAAAEALGVLVGLGLGEEGVLEMLEGVGGGLGGRRSWLGVLRRGGNGNPWENVQEMVERQKVSKGEGRGLGLVWCTPFWMYVLW